MDQFIKHDKELKKQFHDQIAKLIPNIADQIQVEGNNTPILNRGFFDIDLSQLNQSTLGIQLDALIAIQKSLMQDKINPESELKQLKKNYPGLKNDRSPTGQLVNNYIQYLTNLRSKLDQSSQPRIKH